MNDNDELLRTIVKTIAICFCVVIVSSTGCIANKQYQTRMLIQTSNVHPIDAKCAIDSDVSAVCVVRATK